MAAFSATESIVMDIRERFARTMNSLFAHMGVDATYQRAGQAPVTIRIILRQLDPMVELGDRMIAAESLRVDVRRSEWSLPERGDCIAVGKQHYRIEGEPVLDQHQLIWMINVLPVSSSGNQKTVQLQWG